MNDENVNSEFARRIYVPHETIEADKSDTESLRSEINSLATVWNGLRKKNTGLTVEFSAQEFSERYEMIREIARGAMGSVHLAQDKQLKRQVAIKLIRAGQFASQEEVHRFYSEARTAANLEHANIVAVYDVGKIGNQNFMVMEFVDGPTLAQKVRARKLPFAETATIVASIANGLTAAHKKGVVHRDIKPQNILLADKNQPKIADFGVAKIIQNENDQTRDGQVMGTPNYMPPEQALGKKNLVDQRSDIYSLGATLYFLLANRPPFRGETPVETMRQVINQQPLRPTIFDKQIPRDLETICLKALQKSPEQRYQTAAQFAEDLDRWLAGTPIRARRIWLTTRAYRWCKRNPRLVRVTAAVLMLGLLAYAIGANVLRHQKTSGLVEQLISAGPEDVPNIIDSLVNNKRIAASKLAAAAKVIPETDPTSLTKIRIAMAHLQNKPKTELTSEIATCDPAYLHLVLGVLKPASPQLCNALWSKATASNVRPGQKIRSFSALAQLDASNTDWPNHASAVVDELLMVPRVDFDTWKNLLSPVKQHLGNRLQEILTSESGNERNKEIVGQILATWFPEQSSMTFDILMNASDAQFREMYGRLVINDEIESACSQKLVETRELHWNNPKIINGTMEADNAEWAQVTEGLRDEISIYQGHIDSHQIICFNLPLDRLLPISNQLKGTGYRPSRVRTSIDGDGQCLVACLWVRDGVDWKLHVGETSQRIQSLNKLYHESWIEAEDCSFCGSKRNRNSFIGLWVSHEVAEKGLWTATEHGGQRSIELDLSANALEMTLECTGIGLGYEWIRLNGSSVENSEPVFCAIALHNDMRSDWVTEKFSLDWFGMCTNPGIRRVRDTTMFSEVDEETDLRTLKFQGIYHLGDGFRSHRILSLDKNKHLESARILTAEDYRCVSVDQVIEDGKSWYLSVWRRPSVNAGYLRPLWRQQARSIAILLKSDQEYLDVLKYLRTTEDNTVRTEFIHSAATMGVRPERLIELLVKEENPGIQYGLTIAIGEFLPQEIRPEILAKLHVYLRQQLAKADQIAPRSAALWLCKKWNWSTDVVISPDKKTLPPEPQPGDWFENSQGQAFYVIESPKVLMEDRFIDIEKQIYPRKSANIYANLLAVSATRVTIGQFENFTAATGKEIDSVVFDESGVDRHPDQPVYQVNMFTLAEYCNWLSKAEGIPESEWCFIPDAEGKYGPRMQSAPDFITRTGYRPLTFYESECYLDRNDTNDFYGNNSAFRPRYIAGYGRRSGTQKDNHIFSVFEQTPSHTGDFVYAFGFRAIGPILLKYDRSFLKYRSIGNPNSNGFENAPSVIEFASGRSSDAIGEASYIKLGNFSFDGRRQSRESVFPGILNYSPDQVFHSYRRESFEMESIRSPTTDHFFIDQNEGSSIRLARTIRN